MEKRRLPTTTTFRKPCNSGGSPRGPPGGPLGGQPLNSLSWGSPWRRQLLLAARSRARGLQALLARVATCRLGICRGATWQLVAWQLFRLSSCPLIAIFPGPNKRPELPPGTPPGTAPQKPTNPQNYITFFVTKVFFLKMI